jgi:glyoxylase-like metal-dependent hydrolase (beta-lactamase superfamily II)
MLRSFAHRRAIVAAALLCASRATAIGQPATTHPRTADEYPSILTFRTVRVADGVYAFITPEERSSFQAGNSVAVVGDDGVLVFDTGNIPSMTRRQIAEIRRLTDKPVRFVVNSHWHPDHTLGNAEYRAAFPGVTVIGTVATRAGILERVPAYIDQMRSFAPTDSAMRLRLATGRMRDGSPMPDAIRLTWGLTTRDYAEFMPEVVHTTPSAPDSVFRHSLTVTLGKRRVQIVSPGRGNTDGDAFIFLPDERVLLTGDLVTVPCPFPGTAYFADWIRSLDALLAQRASLIVPGHGDVQHDDAYVRMVRELLTFTLDRVRDGVKHGVPLDTLQKQVDFTAFAKRFTGDDPVRSAAFANFYVQPAVARAYEEVKLDSTAARSTSTAPWPLDRPGFVFDARRRRAVLFGGRDGPRSNGTWEWDGSIWRERAIVGPSARHSHGMVFDSRRGRTMLFGGFDSTGFRGDTWEFDGTSWQKMADTGPAPRAAFGMAYDSARGRTVLFGGGRDFADPVFTDTWEWDGRAWTRVATSGPAGNIFLKMSYDARRQRVVAFGGRGGGGETWEWDGRAWSRAGTSGPPPRDHHAMTYDARRQRVVIFGGGRQLPNGDFPRDTTGAWLRDLWAWDGMAWTQLAENGPPSRGGQPGLTYDPVRDRLILFGGGNLSGTWEWDGRRWTQVSDPPQRRREQR